MKSKRQERVRFTAAWICLLAVAILYAPLAGGAWLAHSMAGMNCCAGGYCPIAAHHHPKQKGNSSQSSTPMGCGHKMGGTDGMGTMKSCSLSCCPDPARAALIPGAFLLPVVSAAPGTEEISQPVVIATALALSRFAKPLSPPPRFAAPVLS